VEKNAESAIGINNRWMKVGGVIIKAATSLKLQALHKSQEKA
jgi:hypothetical protein